MNAYEFILLAGLLVTVIGTRWLDHRIAERERVRALHPSSWPLESDGIERPER
jgi:hypothetical protein